MNYADILKYGLATVKSVATSAQGAKADTALQASDANAIRVFVNKAFYANLTATVAFANNWVKLPFGAGDIQYNNGYTFTNSEITISESGHYQMTGAFACQNMPSGTTKFVLGAYKNGVLVGYLSRGFASLPTGDFFGTTGVFNLAANAGDKLDLRMFIGTVFDAICIYTQIGLVRL